MHACVQIKCVRAFFVHFHAFTARYLCGAVRDTISSDEKNEQPYDLPATNRWVFFFLCWQQPKEERAAFDEMPIPERQKLTHRAIRLE